MNAIRRLPKVELHLHLDCSLSYAAVSRLDPSVSREEFDSGFVAPRQCASLADFLTRAPRGFALLQSTDALRLATDDVFGQLESDGVIYAEIRFAPLLHLAGGLSPDDVVAGVDRATEACIRSTGIEARLILCTLRHFTEEQSLRTAELVARFRGSRVVALDLAGDEAGFRLDAHIPAFRFAIDHGLHRTAHAGEAAGADSVRETLRALHPTRIGHGVRSVEDRTLVEHLKASRIHLELCPTSNEQTGAWRPYSDHPIDRLSREGLSLSISTDARTISNIDLLREYARLAETFGWSEADFLRCNRAALEAAFVDEPVRRRLMQRLV